MNEQRIISGPCSVYPSDWNHVKPMSLEEEVGAGSKVTVECEEPRVNRGSSEVTCITGNQWQFEEKPDCALRELMLLLLVLRFRSCVYCLPIMFCLQS